MWRIGKIRVLGQLWPNLPWIQRKGGPAEILFVFEFYHGLTFDLEEWNLKNEGTRISKEVLSNFCDC